jgi:hypothetical protein
MKRLLMFSVVAALTIFALDSTVLQAQENPEQAKTNLYKKFVDNRGPNQEVAYQAGKEYLEKYGKDNDKYTQYI